jgi:DNA polymerase-3 subunit delta
MADRVYIIAGKDEPLVNAKCQELVDSLLDPQQRVTALLSVDADEAVASDVLDELRTVPFLADKRVVVIKGADEFVSKYRTILEKYFEKPAPTGVLVMTVSSWDGRTKVTREHPPSRAMADRVYIIAGKHEVRLDRDAAELLVELAGPELAQLYNEVDKLVLFARDEKTIRPPHVESLIGHNRMYGAFEVIDAMTAGDAAEAVTRLRKMFEEDKDAEYTVVGAFAYHVRRMFQAKKLLDKRTSPELIAKQLRIGYNRNQFFAQLGRVSLPQIAALLEELAAIDYAAKTGQAQIPVAIEQLVLRLSAPGTSSSHTRP